MLRFCDGPGHLGTTTLPLKYESVGSAVGVSSSTLVSSSAVLAASALRTVDLTPLDSLSCYVGIRSEIATSFPVAAGIYVVLQIMDVANNPLITLTHDANHLMQIFRGDYNGVLIGTAIEATTTDPHYLELGVTFSTTAGAIGLRAHHETPKSSVNLISLSGINTGPDGWSKITHYIHSGNARSHFYVLDGAAPNGYFLGPQRVYTCFPNGPGLLTQWTPNAGFNYAAVDDPTPDADATYVRSQTDGARDLYDTDETPIPTLVDINGVQINNIARKESSGFTNRIGGLLKLAAIHEGPSQSLAAGYNDRRLIYDRNPETGLRFTRAEIAASQIGAVEHSA